MSEQGFVPVPDPTKLTTDAVTLAKQEIEKILDIRLCALRELIEEKIAGRDTALAAALKAAQELALQRIESSALAIDKAAISTTKQIDGLVLRIEDLKERIAELSRKDWAVVGAYIIGAVGIVGLAVTALAWHR